MNARQSILEKLKASAKSQIPTVNIDNPEPGQRLFYPLDTAQPATSRLDRFIEQALAANAKVTVIQDKEKLADAIKKYLILCQLPFVIQYSDPSLTPFIANSGLTLDYGQCTFQHKVSLISTHAGIAETGTLVSLANANLSTGSLFLTEYCLAVLEEDTILDNLEDLWLKIQNANKSLPRTINLITGPSRTGDIEQSIEIGAHGPCHLHIFICTENH